MKESQLHSHEDLLGVFFTVIHQINLYTHELTETSPGKMCRSCGQG